MGTLLQNSVDNGENPSKPQRQNTPSMAPGKTVESGTIWIVLQRI